MATAERCRQLSVGNLAHFVHGSGSCKTEPLVETDGPGVLSRHFQERSAQAGALKTGERHLHERGTQAAPAMLRRNAKVLDRSHAVAIDNTLHRTTVSGRSVVAIAGD